MDDGMNNIFTYRNIQISVVQGDITLQVTDAIVNAANSGLRGGGGVDGAIHRAGGPQIMLECQKIISRIGRLEPGKAVITTGGNLKARYVIHTVGPIWRGGEYNEADVLASAYKECLKLATSYKLKSISFPSISTGAYGYPIKQAADIAVKSVLQYIDSMATSLEIIEFVLYDKIAYDIYIEALNHYLSK